MRTLLKLSFILLTFTFIGNTAASQESINSSNALDYVGQNVNICGALAQIKDFKKGIYLNIDRDYPNQTITFVIWDNNLERIEKEWGSFRSLKSKTVCASGKVNTYKGKPRISINSSYDFTVK
ncbi:MAG: DNA/RNA endonuclease YhcR with UshA esterase domain [Cognaticolwellia sp.]|jgi:DNA/RNA endonuclease YhcR with UshA esterase domain